MLRKISAENKLLKNLNILSCFCRNTEYDIEHFDHTSQKIPHTYKNHVDISVNIIS